MQRSLPNITQLLFHHANSFKISCMVKCISSQKKELKIHKKIVISHHHLRKVLSCLFTCIVVFQVLEQIRFESLATGTKLIAQDHINYCMISSTDCCG